MLIFRGAVLILLWMGADAKCDHKWESYWNIDIQAQGVPFESSKMYMVGRGNYDGSLMPAKIHTNSKKAYVYDKQVWDFKFLKKNPNYNYVWVNANSRPDSENVVKVSSYSVARAVVNGYLNFGFAYDDGSGFVYYNYGSQTTPTQIEILTCVEKNYETACSSDDLDTCRNDLRNRVQEVNNLKDQKQKLDMDIRSLRETLEQRELIIRQKEDELSRCQPQSGSQSRLNINDCAQHSTSNNDRLLLNCNQELTLCQNSAGQPSRTQENCQEVQNQILQLENDKNTLQQEITGFRSQLIAEQNKYVELQAEKKEVEKQKNKILFEKADLETSYQGVNGAVKVIRDIPGKLDEEQMKKILDAVKAKLPAYVFDKK